MSGTADAPHWEEIQPILELFFPQFFDPEDPGYVDPDILQQLAFIAEDARPWCLPESKQNLAQAMFTAYLVSMREETKTGATTVPVAGPIVSEREGDIAVTYAQPASSSTATLSKRPPSDPWDAWNRLWILCGRGSITSRYGDGAKTALGCTNFLRVRAWNVWYPIW